MQPTGPQLPPLLQSATLAKSSDVRSAWRVGQVLQGVVARESSQGQTALQIGRQLVQAETGNLRLSPGQPLRLEVVSLSRDLPVLRLLSALRRDAVSQALRQVLPNQRPLPQALSTLAAIASQPQTAGAPPQISQLARAIIQRLPDPGRVSTPQGLRQSLNNSGTFLEGRLAQAASALTAGRAGGANPASPAQTAQGDFKAGLLQLAEQLRQARAPAGRDASMSPAAAARPVTAAHPMPAPPAAAGTAQPLSQAALDVLAPLRPGMPPRPQTPVNPRNLRLDMVQLLQRGGLLKQVESALSRVKLNQLASLPQERQQPPEWLVELPVRRSEQAIDIWGLRIRQETERKREEAEAAVSGWSVMLAFDLPGLGPMQAQVTLREDNRIATRFLSEQGEPLRQVSQYLPRLRARLEQAGLNVDELAVKRGRLSEPAGPRRGGPILDDKA